VVSAVVDVFPRARRFRRLEDDRMTKLVLLAFVTMLCATPAWAQKGKPQPSPCGADIPLSVTIEDVPSGPVSPDYGIDGHTLGYKLVSDGAGTYVHGVGKIAATIGRASCLFNFRLNLYSTPRHVQLNGTALGASRQMYFLNFGRIGSVPVTEPANDNTALDQFCAGAVDKSTFESDTPQDNYGGCGVDEHGKRYVLRYAGGTIDDDSPHYKLRYHLDQVDGTSLDGYNGDCDVTPELCELAWVRVYHPDADTWIITPHDISPNGPAAAAFWEVVRRGTGPILIDSLPFRMTLRRLQ
jgi:hypothetical protein